MSDKDIVRQFYSAPLLFSPLGAHVLLLLLCLLAQVTNLLLPVICRLLHCLAPLIFLCQLQLVLQHAYQRELSVDLQLKSHFQWWFLMRCTSVVVHNLFIFTFILFRLHISWALQYKEECQRWICGSIFSFPVYEILKRNFCYSIFLNWVKDYFFHVFVHMMILICAIVKTWRSYFKILVTFF